MTAREARDRLIHTLQARLPQIVHLPGTPGHERGRRVYFTGVDRHPSVVLRPRSAEEVAEVVRIVGGEGGRLSVRGGGHGFTSDGVADGVPTLDLSALDGMAVDREGRIARAGGGITTGAFTREAGQAGLATGFGDSPKVGVGGIVQAGGIGFLHRRLGLAADALVGAQVVTADGQIREVDAASEPDLFWALRGGGGGFGVVTRVDLRLAPVDRIVGGMLMARTDAPGFERTLAHLAEAPTEVSGIVQVMRAPVMPLIPEELQGRMILAAFLVHSGRPEEGERWVETLRKVAPPVMDTLAAVPYPAVFEEHGGPPDPPLLRWRSVFRETPSPEEFGNLFDLLEEPHDGIMRILQLRPLGGAVAAPPADSTAFAHRDAPLLASAGAVFATEAEAETHRVWVEAVQGVLEGPRRRGAYAGFLGAEDPGGPADAWPEPHRSRLRSIRERHDPDRVFHAPVDLAGNGLIPDARSG